MVTIGPWLDGLAATTKGVTFLMYVFSQGCSRKENFLYRLGPSPDAGGAMSASRISREDVVRRRAARPTRFFLTGGTGFLGSHLAVALLEKGHRVCLLARSLEQQSAEDRVQALLDWFGLPADRPPGAPGRRGRHHPAGPRRGAGASPRGASARRTRSFTAPPTRPSPNANGPRWRRSTAAGCRRSWSVAAGEQRLFLPSREHGVCRRQHVRTLR